MLPSFTTHPFDDDKLKEECGIFGIYRTPDAAAHAALGLHALQHRGQEAAGIVTRNGAQFYAHKEAGHVGDIFGAEKVIQSLPGDVAIGHVRYATCGGAGLRNVQPLYADLNFGGLAIAHNGNLTNAMTIKRELVKSGSLFQSTSDTEVVIHLMALSGQPTVKDKLIEACRKIEGAYSFVALSKDGLMGVRDPHGVRPLVLGQLDSAYVLASETCALDIIGAAYLRDVGPGELIVIDETGLQSYFPFQKVSPRFCIFEYVYFARPDSRVENKSVYEARKAIGAVLAKEAPVKADVVVPVPDSGVPGAIGYAQAANIPFELGIIRNHYVGRTFIEPSDKIRHLGVKLKHNPNQNQIAGKRVILVDDSIVRGTTSKKIVDMVRAAGAKEVHMRIASPPITHSCFYGIDTPTRTELVAANYSVAEIQQALGVDSLAFISIDGLYRAVGEAKRNKDMPQYCDACFTGEYAINLTDEQNQVTAPLPLFAEKAKA
ncbi:MAG: amidophosphoribosyltransferase [Dongiaceae bacterium]